MALLNHEPDKEKKTSKPLLTRGAKVQVNNKVNRMDIDQRTGEEEKTPEKYVVTSSVTEPVNIRVDNHIRNNISALITMGHADSQKEMVDMLVNIYVEDLDSSEYKRFNDLVKIYEDKDVRRLEKKAKKK